MLEFKLLSKILDDQNFFILNQYNITENDFTEGKQAFNFIKQYVIEHKDTPSASTVAEEVEFEYIDTHDKLQYLCKTLKSNSAKRMVFDILQNQASDKFNQLKGADFVDWLQQEVTNIKDRTDTHTSLGTNFATNGTERLEWYKEAEQKEGFMSVPTPYNALTEAMAGGNDLGDYVLLMAYSNQGKSWIASQFGLTAWNNGFGVIHYSPELSKRQTIQRLDTLQGHFSNVHLQTGELFEKVKKEYVEYLENFSDINEVPYIVKTMEDLLMGLSVETIESDLAQNPNIKFVIIDGFNLMNHKGKGNNRDLMTTTSRRLRQVFGKYGIIGLVVHQTPTSAQKENLKDIEELEEDFPVAPSLTQYSETVAVIQDACTVLTFAHKDGKGKLAVRKARKPCIDFEVNLHVNYNMGYITQVEANYTNQFGGNEDDI
jgi:replicative DNA helicase